MFRTAIVATLLCACAPKAAWHGEVQRQATLALECPEADIAVESHTGHNYDAVGCQRGIRYVCRDRACAPSSPVADGTGPAFGRTYQRAVETHRRLWNNRARLAEFCSIQGPFSVKVLVAPSGQVVSVEAPQAQDCLTGVFRTWPMPPGNGTLFMMEVFRP